MAGLKFVIPKAKRTDFGHMYGLMEARCPNICRKSGFVFNESAGVFSISDAGCMNESVAAYCKSSLKRVNAIPITEKLISEQLRLLEKVVGKRIKLKENNESNKNITVQALKAVSETMDMLNNQVQEAISQVQQLSGQDIILTKLHGLSSIVEASQTDVSQAITDVTAIRTSENYVSDINSDDDELHEDDSDPKGVVMGIDDATKDIDDVGKIVDSGQNVIIDDTKN